MDENDVRDENDENDQDDENEAELRHETAETALTFASPIGPLTLVERDGALGAVYLRDDARLRGVAGAAARPSSLLSEARAQLEAYFRGARRTFDLPLAPRGTAFQHAVWSELARIPFAQTRTYRDVARAIGRPDACRAVGAANGRNPLAIVVPCHRVVGTGGALTGYAGGLPAKRWLLACERRAMTGPARVAW